MERDSTAILLALRGSAPKVRVSSPFLSGSILNVSSTYCRPRSTSAVRRPDRIKRPDFSAPCFSSLKLTAPEG